MILNYRMGRAIERLIREWQPDAIYERYSLYQTSGLKLAHKFKLPRILEVNTLLAQEQANRLHFPQLAKRVEVALWQRERAMICVSQKLKDLMIAEANLHLDRMAGFAISPVAVDVKMFNPAVEPDPEVLEIGNGRKVAGYVGTLTAWHGVDLFFETAQLLKKHNDSTIILAVGGEPERVEKLRERARSLDVDSHLVFHGSIDHHKVPGFLAAMDMCLIADTQDWSSPTKFFEFAAMEKPIIASRSPSVEEVFGNTEAGLFFQRGSAQGMAEAIEKVQNDPELARRMGAAARRRVLERYTWACNVKAIMQLYQAMGCEAAEYPPEACPTPANGVDSPAGA